MKKTGKAYYMISAVAQKYNIHPQTLRLYEREGLLKPSRTEGNTRLYSEEDLEQLETILSLTRDLGVNLAGVEVILNMRRKIQQMQGEVNEFMEYVKRELTRGNLEAAYELYQRAQNPARAAQVARRLGKLNEAAQLYEKSGDKVRAAQLYREAGHECRITRVRIAPPSAFSIQHSSCASVATTQAGSPSPPMVFDASFAATAGVKARRRASSTKPAFRRDIAAASSKASSLTLTKNCLPRFVAPGALRKTFPAANARRRACA